VSFTTLKLATELQIVPVSVESMQYFPSSACDEPVQPLQNASCCELLLDAVNPLHVPTPMLPTTVSRSFAFCFCLQEALVGMTPTALSLVAFGRASLHASPALSQLVLSLTQFARALLALSLPYGLM
jgi:hypothetical protein